MGAPDLTRGINDPFVLAGRHSARSHLMGGREGGIGWIEALVLDLDKPGLEVGVIDPLEIAGLVVASALWFGFPHKRASVGCSDVDFRGAVHVGNSRARKEAFHGVRLVECACRVRNATPPVHGVWEHAARITIAGEAYMATHVRKFGAEHFDVETTRPREEWEKPRREHRHGFNLSAVAMAVQVLEIVDESGENWTFPGICGFGIRRGQ